MEYNFDNIRNEGLLLYEYVRGSTAYGLALPTSDIDKSAVFIMKKDDVYGISDHKIEQVNDERNDTSWYEIGKYIELLCKANPTMLESLFVDDEFVLYCHPAFKIIKDNRDVFVTKETFKSFIGYAKTQIYKARGLNKKIVNEVTERLTPIDFCYCFNEGQGTIPVKDWLAQRGLKQQYCGLNHMPNMIQMFGMFYDYGTHIRCEFKTADDWNNYWLCTPGANLNFLYELGDAYPNACVRDYLDNNEWQDLLEMVQPKGYHGIQREDGMSNEIRLDSIVKGDTCINKLCYNLNGYQVHCREYKEYQEWVKMRNPQRYLENKDKEFDRKNMMHCMRLMNMGIEIAKTGKVNINRTNIDRDELLNIRLGNTTYDELIAKADAKQKELEEAIKESTLPEAVDREKINKILIDIRKEFEKYENCSF